MRLPLRMPFSLDAAFTSVAASALVMPIEIARVPQNLRLVNTRVKLCNILKWW